MNNLCCFSQSWIDPFIDNIIKVPKIYGPTDFNNGADISNLDNYNGNVPNSSAIRQQNACLMQQVECEFALTQQYEKQLIAIGLLTNAFPSFSVRDSVGASHFHNAFAEIDSMLSGTKELSIARSVFLVENAFYENTLDYFDY